MDDGQLYDDMKRGAPVAHCRDKIEADRRGRIADEVRRTRPILLPRWSI